MVALNPPKTFASDILPSNHTPTEARGRVTLITLKPRAFRNLSIRASVMPREGHQQQASLGDALLNSSRKNDVVDVIRRTGLSNCLSETNLHATVPGLESKTRGKVCRFETVMHLFVLFIFIVSLGF